MIFAMTKLAMKNLKKRPSHRTVLFGTGTARSGGSLVCNLLSVRKDYGVTTDMLHFFRFIFNKYNPINIRNKKLLVLELCLRLKYRFKINLNPKIMIKKIIKLNTYLDIYLTIIDFLKKITKKKYYGEYANSEWRNVSTFLELDKNFKAFQIIRDPRAVLTSFKEITFEKNLKYFNIIFDWIDSINYLKKNKKKYKASRFIDIKFEDIHNNPIKTSKKFCKFLNVKFHSRMLDTKLWPLLLKNKIYQVNISNYNQKKTFGFSKQRTLNWKKRIKNWELALVQDLLNKYLKEFKYDILATNKSHLKEAYKIISKDKELLKKIIKFKKKNIVDHKKLRDPSNPKNWSATNFVKYPNKKFSETSDYKKYIKEFDLVKNQIERI